MDQSNILRYQPVSNEKLKVARDLRKAMTEAEKVFWAVVRNRKLDGLKFRRQQPIHGFIADFYCPERNLVVEIDGTSHDGNDKNAYDVERTQILEGHRIRVIRLKNEEVLVNLQGVIKRLSSSTNSPSPAERGPGGEVGQRGGRKS